MSEVVDAGAVDAGVYVVEDGGASVRITFMQTGEVGDADCGGAAAGDPGDEG